MKFSPSGHYDKACLFAVTGRVPLAAVRESHAAQDDMGEWATANANSLRLGLADARLQQLADQERAGLVRESLSRFVPIRNDEELWRRQHCSGDCHQGRQPCQEMACWEPIDGEEEKVARRFAVIVAVAVVAMVAAPFVAPFVARLI